MRWVEEDGAGWRLKWAGWRWMELGGARWSWVELGGSEWRWVHGLVIPNCISFFQMIYTFNYNFNLAIQSYIFTSKPINLLFYRITRISVILLCLDSYAYLQSQHSEYNFTLECFVHLSFFQKYICRLIDWLINWLINNHLFMMEIYITCLLQTLHFSSCLRQFEVKNILRRLTMVADNISWLVAPSPEFVWFLRVWFLKILKLTKLRRK